MAIVEGLCKNCGSLIMLEQRETLCECLFCNCVFPASEAIDLAADSTGHVFPNEPYEKREDTKKYTVTPVYVDPIPAAVKRAEQSAAIEKKEVVEYEVTPEDVEFPKKTLWLILSFTAVFIAAVLAIAIPMYMFRTSHREALAEKMDTVFEGFTVDTKKQDGYYTGFYLHGQKNTQLSVVTEDAVNPELVYAAFENYALCRAEEYGLDKDDFRSVYAPLSLYVYGKGESYFVEVSDEKDLAVTSVQKLA